MASEPKPPYTSVSDVEAFFQRIQTIAEPKPPKKIDSGWVASYGFETAHPSAIPAMLRWLGVINDEGESTGVWDGLRVDSKRAATLQDLLKKGYANIVDAVDVEHATMADLRGAFVDIYGIGDPKRHISCFLALCQQAGIATEAAVPPARDSKPKHDAARPKAKAAPKAAPAAKESSQQYQQQRTRGGPGESVADGVTVMLNVEIPAEMTEEQIRERIVAIRRAVDSAGNLDS